ncbi:hypothetical protein BC833DRAFT_604653 [Globomyces pollinis-pini]|nr:hypothetical protein BC833DRAFT_604653 [Globomyces pollinis-pini]
MARYTPSLITYSIAGMFVVAFILLLLPLLNPLLAYLSTLNLALKIGSFTLIEDSVDLLKNFGSAILSVLAGVFVFCIGNIIMYFRATVAYWRAANFPMSVNEFVTVRTAGGIESLLGLRSIWFKHSLMQLSVYLILFASISNMVFPFAVTVKKDTVVCTDESVALSTGLNPDKEKFKTTGFLQSGGAFIKASTSAQILNGDIGTITDRCSASQVNLGANKFAYLLPPILDQNTNRIEAQNITFIQGEINCDSSSSSKKSPGLMDEFKVGKSTIKVEDQSQFVLGYGMEEKVMQKDSVSRVYIPFLDLGSEDMQIGPNCKLSASIVAADMIYNFQEKKWTSKTLPTILYSNYSDSGFFPSSKQAETIEKKRPELFKGGLLDSAVSPIGDEKNCYAYQSLTTSTYVTKFTWGDVFEERVKNMTLKMDNLVDRLKKRFQYGLCAVALEPQSLQNTKINYCRQFNTVQIKYSTVVPLALIVVVVASICLAGVMKNKDIEWKSDDDILLLMSAGDPSFSKTLQANQKNGELDDAFANTAKFQLIDQKFQFIK